MAVTFQLNLTANEFNTAAGKLKEMGLGPQALEGGTLPEHQGVLLSYAVATQAGPPMQANVTFTVQKKPFFVTVGEIENAVKQMLGIA